MTSPFRQVYRCDYQAVWLGLGTIVLLLGWFFLDGDIGVNFADEGYLWYGTEALQRGEVPMRDFQAYDPGRYVWTAAWSFVLGRDLVALRLACTLFACLGVFAGLLAARRLSRNGWFLTSVALLLAAWMHPRYKSFEQSIALMSVYAGVLLLEHPTARRHFGVGVFGGLVAFMGRNHGLYHVMAFGVLIGYVAWSRGGRDWWLGGASWAAGLVMGYLPQWTMFALVPGYLRAFLQSLQEISAKGTNLSVAVPWPWRVPLPYNDIMWAPSFIEGCFYLLFPIFFVCVGVGMCWLGRERLRQQPMLLAVAFVCLPYAHYVFSRPDLVHLGHAAPVLALGTIALAVNCTRLWKVVAPLLACASLLTVVPHTGLARKLFGSKIFVRVPLAGETMFIQINEASLVSKAGTLAQKLAKPDEPILFLPHFPALYPLTGRRSPIRQIYFILPATAEEDRQTVAEIEAAGVQWVLLNDYALDNRDDLRFQNTNPIVFEHLRANFGAVPVEKLPSNLTVLRRFRRP
ncbi:MAG TPA: hypothetical protein VFD27_14870 [Chthoniobacteraceae bacterium]|jgi:hypothetical protein|nr:hypothetical protein [Chthoniobacteraceae bacterium]